MNDVPDRIGHLSNELAAKFLTTAVLEQREPLPTVALDRVSKPGRWEAAPVRHLVDEAMKRFTSESRTSADAWLSPVLHATLRLTRREAADPGIWNHLALRVAPDYVFWRHLGRPLVNRARFSGPFHSQTFARLWWAAELFRDGPDYGPALVACGNQDVLNTVLRAAVILHRPTAQAILRLLTNGAMRTGREVNGLTHMVNMVGGTIAYEALAPDVPQDADSYRDWVEDLAGVLVPYDSLPDGPDDGRVPASSVNILVSLFEKLFAEASVRGRKAAE